MPTSINSIDNRFNRKSIMRLHLFMKSRWSCDGGLQHPIRIYTFRCHVEPTAKKQNSEKNRTGSACGESNDNQQLDNHFVLRFSPRPPPSPPTPKGQERIWHACPFIFVRSSVAALTQQLCDITNFHVWFLFCFCRRAFFLVFHLLNIAKIYNCWLFLRFSWIFFCFLNFPMFAFFSGDLCCLGHGSLKKCFFGHFAKSGLSQLTVSR